MLDYQTIMAGDDMNWLYRAEVKMTEYAVDILKAIESSDVYGTLLKKLPSKRVSLYFLKIIREEVHPYIHKAYRARLYRRNGRTISKDDSIIILPKSGIFCELAKYWDFKDMPLVLIDPVSFKIRTLCYPGVIKSSVAAFLRNFFEMILGAIDRIKKTNVTVPRTKEPTIACHYAEGIDHSRRNDINWFPESGIRPERILMYIDRRPSKTRRPIERKYISELERQGFRWVALKRGMVERQGSDYWRVPDFPKDKLIKGEVAVTEVDQWIVKAGNDLLKQVHFWRSFYDEFNVRINYIPEEGLAKNIIQAIAFDIDKEKGGLLLGKQRSDLFFPGIHAPGDQPKHIFFTWNKRAEMYLRPNCNQIQRLVITGYPNNIFQKFKNKSGELRAKGCGFVLAIFGSGHGLDTGQSTEKMAKFYKAFFRWMLEDPTVGLIIKPKKPKFFNRLPPGIHEMFRKAEETGRCIKIKDSWGRLPAEAAFGADMAVGIASPSAVIEAVIAGCRGIFYDIMKFQYHEFYKWGNEKLIFNDLAKMMEAIKKYKNKSRDEVLLGDWSDHMDKVDPFRDGKGGMRMGMYMCRLLECFDKGKTCYEAIEDADRLYKEKWGNDKIVEMEREYAKL